MKKIVFGLFLFVGMEAEAQTFAEWFAQNKTQKKYYLQQITALKVYVSRLEAGYALVDSGLNLIGTIKSDELDLHGSFYKGLSVVNPAIPGTAAVREIIGLQAFIVDQCSVSLKRYREGAGLNRGEVNYIAAVFSAVVMNGMEDIDGLLDLVSSGRLKLSDDQRMERIREINQAMKERYGVVCRLAGQADVLCLQRQMDRGTLEVVGGLYGVR